ncbi:MAG TPA: ABC transporter permease [Thermoanaerobaculia bacterium]|jgi:predicted permease|nr:ABC transporter permease [Thermoanaerobaculia bacterium]
MRALDRLRLRLRSLLRREAVEAEMHAELRFHLEMQAEELIAAGMGPVEARHAAMRALGPLSRIEEECRDMRRTRWIETFLQDVRYALRALRLSPAFTIVATLSLALGIGANTAIFSLMDALLLRSLPVQTPGRLVALGDPSRVGGKSEGSIRTDLFSLPLYRELREKNQVLSGLYASGRTGRLEVGTDRSSAQPERARGRLVSGNYFAVLGVPAFLGRTFNGEEDRSAGSAPYVVISHDYWQRRFASDPGVLGRAITLNNYPFTIIGVTPPEFFGDIVGTATDVWIPMMMQRQVNPGRDFLERWDVHWLLLMGRLKPGVSVEQARGSIGSLFKQIIASQVIPEDMLGDRPGDLHIDVSPGGAGFSYLRRQFSRPLATLMAIVALVLLIACANVANLLLERATGRQKEISVRLALGAGRGRLVRQLLTESLVLSLLGGSLGVFFAFWADAGLLKLMIGSTRSPALDLRPNLTVLAFTAAVSLLTGLLFGLAPALRSTRVELAPALKESSRNLAGAGAGRRWPLGKILVVSQFAISLLLLIGAGLFVRTLVNLQRLDLGYPREGLLMLQLDPVAAGVPRERLGTFVEQLLERLRAVPGVDAVTLSENGLFSGTESSTSIAISGRPPIPDPDDDVAYDRVAPDYFEVVGIPILQGRGFGTEDRIGTLPVAVINETMARFYFPKQNPIGQRFAGTDEPERVYEVVGVSKDARDHELRGAVPRRYYLPLLQRSDDLSAFNAEIRTRDPKVLIEPIRKAVQDFNPRLAVLDLVPLGTNINESIDDDRLVAKLSAVFGLLALILASIGLYGVISFTVARRTNEIGIRMALGAGHNRVLWMVLRETLLLALAGIILGLLAVLASGRVMASRLYGLSAYDPPTLVAATLVLVLVAVLAGGIPGSRATRVDPTEALRYE